MRCGCRGSDYDDDDVAPVAPAAADGDGSRRASDPRRPADNDVRRVSNPWSRNQMRNWMRCCRVWPSWSPPFPLRVACTLGGSCCLTLRRAGVGGGVSCGWVSFGHLLLVGLVDCE